MNRLADEAAYFGAVQDGVDSQQERITELEQQLAESGRNVGGEEMSTTEIARNRILDLEQQLADSQEREVMLREFVQKIKEQTPEKPDYWSSCSQCEHNSNEAEDILEALVVTEPK